MLLVLARIFWGRAIPSKTAHSAQSRLHVDSDYEICEKITRQPSQVLPLVAVLLSALLASSAALAEVPRGVFCLFPAGQKGKARTFINPDVDGLSIRQTWADLEPSEGAFNWTYLDMMVAQAATGKKSVLLRIGTSGGDAALGGNCPTWVMNAVAAENLPASQKFYTFYNKGVVKIAVFWDPVYLAKKTAMITALGARYSSNPAVKIASASFANANSEDWGVPHTGSEVTAWFTAGYTSDKMLAAGKQIIDATMAAF